MTEQKKQPESGANLPAQNGDAQGKLTLQTATISQLLNGWAKKSFYAMLPGKDEKEKERSFTMEAYFAVQIINKSETLQNCDRMSIVNSLVSVATTGLSLNPELRLGYLIPRKGKCYFQSSYMGKREIMMRTGIVKDVWCNIVYKNETFIEHGGTEHRIEHHPMNFGDKGEIVGGYWSAELANGTRPYGIMDIKRIEEIASRSDAVKSAAKNNSKTTWDTDREEMIKKTLINNAWKHLPKTGISDDVIKAIEADSSLDNEEFEEWKQRQEADSTPDWEKDDKNPGKNSHASQFTDAVIVPDEKPAPQPQAQETGSLSDLGKQDAGKQSPSGEKSLL